MSYILYESENNTILICPGYTKQQDNIELLPRKDSEYPDVKFLLKKDEKKMLGVEIQNYLNENELKGYKAELIFSKMLEQNQIPFLYIGQSPAGIEYSTTLNQQMYSRRPDFLVNFLDIGSLFFDVKCRTKIGLNEKSDQYFNVSVEETDTLINLQEYLLMPVWIAFYDANDLEQEKPHRFELLPVSKLKKYRDGICNQLQPEEKELIYTYRIHKDLLTSFKTIDNQLSLNGIGYSSVSDKILLDMADQYKDFFKRIKDKIIECVKKEEILKTNLPKKVKAESFPWAFRKEIEKILDKLIDERKIIHEKNKPLQLSGD